MKLHVFDAADGDCMVLESGDGRLMLIDGGRSGSFTANTAGFLAELEAEGRELDVVCVSHIDADHITGVLKLLDLVLDGRVFEYQRENNPRARPPRFRMPPVRAIWHNGFEQQLGVGLASDVATAMGTATRVLGALDDPQPFAMAQQLAQSEKQSAELSLQAIDVLGIPVNDAASPPGTLQVGGVEPDRAFGAATVTLLAPHAEDVKKLRKVFADWVEKNQGALADLKRVSREQAEELAASADSMAEIRRLVDPAARLAAALDNRGHVTTANLASIMLHAEEDGAVALLTGDGHAEEVVRGLEAQGLVEADEPLHVSVLKMPHHGSEFNVGYEQRGVYMFSPFLRRVTADHYVFNGDGSHHNPDQDIVKAVIDSRLGPAKVRAPNPEADGRFKLWFTSHPSRVSSAADQKHMRKIQRYVQRRARRSKNRMRREFLRGSSFTIEVGEAP